MKRVVVSLLSTLLVIVVVGYAFGPLVLKPARDRADRACSLAMDSEPDYTSRWKVFPIAHWECSTTTGRHKNVGWWPNR